MSGQIHPINKLLFQLVNFFLDLGFEVVEGPEIVTEKDNFDLLGIPVDHPSRDSQDTFWLEDGRLLRTHTSSMQIKIGQKLKPPFRAVVPGRCFRNEATDSSHESQFYQLEVMAVDPQATLSSLVGTLEMMFKTIFKADQKVKFVPHHYPFVEPGLDAYLFRSGRWLEVLGCGMIHPNVLKSMAINSKDHQGFAIGLGIDRLAMIKYGFNDIRHSYRNDFRFLKQFQSISMPSSIKSRPINK